MERKNDDSNASFCGIGIGEFADLSESIDIYLVTWLLLLCWDYGYEGEAKFEWLKRMQWSANTDTMELYIDFAGYACVAGQMEQTNQAI